MHFELGPAEGLVPRSVKELRKRQTAFGGLDTDGVAEVLYRHGHARGPFHDRLRIEHAGAAVFCAEKVVLRRA